MSTILFMVIAIVVYYTMTLLLKVVENQLKRGEGYPELGRKVLGATGENSVKAFIVILQIGSCISYVIFFLEFLNKAFGTTEADRFDNLMYLVGALVIILPLSILNNVNFFVKSSIVGNLFIIATIVMISIIEIQIITQNGGAAFQANKGNLVNLKNLPQLLGVSIFAFNCIIFSLFSINLTN